ncbi:MAG TPA: DUF2062 domain-containing protein [Verrucomicrobiae bacterium]|jgi:uncharacterized protein (DUF2062 family)
MSITLFHLPRQANIEPVLHRKKTKPCPMPPNNQSSRLKRFWRERVIALMVAQFTQGVTPQKIALTVALGMSLGIFPILGATTALCAVAGFWFKLNQPVIQLVNWLASPLQLSLILVFVRLGEWLTGAPYVNFSIPELIEKFHQSPVKFFQEFGLTGWHGIIAWLAIAPFLTAMIYFAVLPPLKALAARRIKNA